MWLTWILRQTHLPRESEQPCLLRQKALSHKEGLEGSRSLGMAVSRARALAEAAQSLMLRGEGRNDPGSLSTMPVRNTFKLVFIVLIFTCCLNLNCYYQ